jgi:hypothetical protein
MSCGLFLFFFLLKEGGGAKEHYVHKRMRGRCDSYYLSVHTCTGKCRCQCICHLT